MNACSVDRFVCTRTERFVTCGARRQCLRNSGSRYELTLWEEITCVWGAANLPLARPSHTLTCTHAQVRSEIEQNAAAPVAELKAVVGACMWVCVHVCSSVSCVFTCISCVFTCVVHDLAHPDRCAFCFNTRVALSVTAREAQRVQELARAAGEAVALGTRCDALQGQLDVTCEVRRRTLPACLVRSVDVSVRVRG